MEVGTAGTPALTFRSQAVHGWDLRADWIRAYVSGLGTLGLPPRSRHAPSGRGTPQDLPIVFDIETLGSLDRSVDFLRSTRLVVSDSGSRTIWELPELDLLAEGASDSAAEEDLLDQIVLLKEAYLESPETELTPRAIALRGKLRTLLG
jgi:hypothetical protein